MQSRKVTTDTATVEVDQEECRIIAQALNEVCNGIDLPEFSTRLGAEREDVLRLLGEFHAVWGKMSGG